MLDVPNFSVTELRVPEFDSSPCLTHKVKEASDRGDDLGPTGNEVCFYDALAQNDSATDLLGDDKLKVIATQLVLTVRKNVSIDWTVRESARTKIRVVVRHIRKQFGFPPDLQVGAVKLVLQQAEALSDEWASV